LSEALFTRERAPGPGQASRAACGPSLKARAVAYLSRREHSRAELARKLAPYAESDQALQVVLDALVREGWQSDARYAKALVHRKADRQGAVRIVHALRQQGIDEDSLAEIREGLRETELERARAVWAKRFGQSPETRNDYARQARFLSARGFSHDVIRKLLGATGDEG